MELKTRNINTAFRSLVEAIHTGKWPDGTPVPLARRPSRNGPVVMVDEPVIVTYSYPRERVLFNAARDANPFSLLYESLWTLAGRNDVAPIAYYTKRMADYSDDGATWNDAYGYRWRTAIPNLDRPEGLSRLAWHRQHGGLDQLDLLVSHLKAEPTSRRAVLQIWNVENDLLKVGGIGYEDCEECGGLGEVQGHNPWCPKCHVNGCPKGKVPSKGSKAVCCNLSVMFTLREERIIAQGVGVPDKTVRSLDMTVISRSEDLIWGFLGADYVTFTVLQEYLAARLGVEVGRYHHFANNLHAYESNWKPDKWLADETPVGPSGYYPKIPLVHDPNVFEQELPRFVTYNNGGRYGNQPKWEEPFFAEVSQPLLDAFHYHKERKDYDAALWATDQIKADDWRVVARAWLERRRLCYARAGKEVKNAVG